MTWVLCGAMRFAACFFIGTGNLHAGVWTEKAVLPTVAYNPVVASLNGIIYVAGGNNGGLNPYTTPTVLSTLYAYNPISNTWTSLANMPDIRYQSDGMGVISNTLYVPGGWTQVNPALPHNNLWAYDTVANTWSTKASMPYLSGGSAAVVINNELYVQTSEDGYDGYYNFLQVYNPANDTWTQLANSPNSHCGPGFGVISNKFYLVGGIDGSGHISGQLDVYDPASNTWTTKSSMPTPAAGSASAVLNGKLYVIGGVDASGNYLNVVEVYNPATDSWTNDTPMPTPRSSAVAGVLNGTIYVIGGSDNGQTLAINEAFTPVVIPPTITNQTANVTSSSGGTASMSVGVSGTAPFTYQWLFDGTNILNATNANLSLANLSAASIGFYTVTVSNSTGGAVSTPVDLFLADTKLFPGLIINGPAGTNYDLQSTPTLAGANWTVLTNITLPTQTYIYLDYSSATNRQQFYRLATTNAGPNPATLAMKLFTQLTINGPAGTNYDLQSAPAGNTNWTTITNFSLSGQPYIYLDYTSATNSRPSYRVVPAPVFTVQPTNTTASTGGTAVFTAIVSGTPPFSYQWTFNGTNIAGATNISLTITNVSSANVGTYALTIINGAHTVTSAAATLTTVDSEKVAFLILIGSLGADYSLQSASVLGGDTDWTTLTNITLTSAVSTYIDLSSATNPQQFYRLVDTNATDSPPLLNLQLLKALVINGNFTTNF
jgi:N-acetylneuraminic acid mutarotase